MVETLIEMVQETVTDLGDSTEANMIKIYFDNTISHIIRLKLSKDCSYYEDTAVCVMQKV